MTDMNILIIVPRFSKKGEFYSFPFGLAYISSYLKSMGFNIYCLNLCDYEESSSTLSIIKNSINKNNINIILTGGMSGHWDLISNVVENTKKVNKNIITIVGGPIITSEPILAMKNMPINFGVIGEGEITAGELLSVLKEKKDTKNIDGIIYYLNGELVRNRDRSPISDLDLLPFPDYENFGYREWLKLVHYSGNNPILENFENVIYSPVIGSRSCPYSCTFCYHPLGKKYRQRSLNNIFLEIDYLTEKFHTNFIGFSDELFSTNTKRMFEFADRIKPYNIKWDAQFRVDNITRDVIRRLKESNLTIMSYGIESLSDKILKSMKKMTTKAEIENALKITREENLFCAGNIILGDPEETLETMNESIDWWKNNPRYGISLRFIMAIPDSPIYQYAIKNNLIKDKLKHIRNHFPIINLTKIPDKNFNKIKKAVYECTENFKYIKKGKLIKSEKLNEKYQNYDFYSLTMQCPACGHIENYKKFSRSYDKFCNLFCKKCYGAFKVEQKKAFYDNYNYFKVFFYKPLYKMYALALKNDIFKPDNKVVINFKNILKKITSK